MKTKLALLTLCTLLFSCSSTKPQLLEYNFSEQHMGTNFRIIIFSNNEKQAQVAAKMAFQRIKEIDHTCSDYIAKSELNQISRTHDEWIKISDDLWQW